MSKALSLLDTGPATAAKGAGSGKKDNNMFTAKQMQQIRNAFGVFDLDDSGSISAEELGEAMETLGQRPTDEELQVWRLNVMQRNNSFTLFSFTCNYSILSWVHRPANTGHVQRSRRKWEWRNRV